MLYNYTKLYLKNKSIKLLTTIVILFTNITIMFYTHRSGNIIPSLFPRFMWKKPTEDKIIYLTFDDGPIPEVTEFVLNQLAMYQAKATFFCVGENIAKYPTIFARILAEGHRVGNHTHTHLNGWQQKDEVYLSDIVRCQMEINKQLSLIHI